MARINDKNKYGQYMTPAEIADLMLSLSKAKANASVLEPSAGEGIFLKLLSPRFKNTIGYEFDPELARLNKNVQNKSFLSVSSEKKYDLIIGNPPYIRWKNLEPVLKEELAHNILWSTYCNSLCDYSAAFILKSVEMLKDGGELIFITPEYWVNTTHSVGMRNYLVENGYFTDIIQFNETPIFEDASVALIIFRYVKSPNAKSKPDIHVRKFLSNKKITETDMRALRSNQEDEKINRLLVTNFKKNQRWILADDKTIESLTAFEEACRPPNNLDFARVGDYCDIGNGLVSGLDLAFQLENIDFQPTEKEKNGLITVAKAKDLQPFFSINDRKYIFLESVRSETELKKNYPHFYKKLAPLKEQLLERYNYGRDLKYWEWAFLRNFKLFNAPTKRIFVPCKERVSHKDYFRFALVEANVLPTQDVTALFPKSETKENIYYILAFLNQKPVFNWMKYNGIAKGNIIEFSEKPIASLPYRRIDFQNLKEAAIHDRIVNITKKILEDKDASLIEKLAFEFNSLLGLGS